MSRQIIFNLGDWDRASARSPF